MANLLQNGSFDGTFRNWNGIPQIQVAEAWFPYWVSQAPGDPAWRNLQPTYRVVARAREPRRVFTGLTAQSYHTRSGTHTAGLMQTVDVPPGQPLRVTAQGSAWVSEADDPLASINPTPVNMRIGVDPTGGTYPFDEQVVWSAEANPYDTFEPFTVEVTATGTRATIFLHSAPTAARRNIYVYWDDIAVDALNAVEPQEDFMLVVQAELPNVGRPVDVYATSTRQLTNVAAAVSGPLGSPTMQAGGQSEGGRGYLWQWRFVPESPGDYSVSITADEVNGETAVVTIRALQADDGICRGHPREQYARTYVLLPPNADPKWMQSVLDVKLWHRAKFTIGFNADDGGVGDLDDRQVIIVNPSAWPQDMVAWYAEHYPGVNVRTVRRGDASTLNRLLSGLG